MLSETLLGAVCGVHKVACASDPKEETGRAPTLKALAHLQQTAESHRLLGHYTAKNFVDLSVDIHAECVECLKSASPAELRKAGIRYGTATNTDECLEGMSGT